MTVEEVFNKLASHMCEGIAFHDEVMRVCAFFGFWGLTKLHMHQAREEKEEYEKLHYYYATHCFKLLQLEEVEKAKLIPDSWHKYTTQAIDIGTKTSTLKNLLNKWIEWERSTKKLYQDMRKELDALGEIDAAIEIDKYIQDVSKELSYVEKQLLKIETINYDWIYITEWMEDLDHKYTKKLGW